MYCPKLTQQSFPTWFNYRNSKPCFQLGFIISTNFQLSGFISSDPHFFSTVIQDHARNFHSKRGYLSTNSHEDHARKLDSTKIPRYPASSYILGGEHQIVRDSFKLEWRPERGPFTRLAHITRLHDNIV
jgi:hypothetical protein